MTFEKYWPTACLPGEYDSMDACDQGRWRGVAQAAYQAGRDSMKAERDALKADAERYQYCRTVTQFCDWQEKPEELDARVDRLIKGEKT